MYISRDTHTHTYLMTQNMIKIKKMLEALPPEEVVAEASPPEPEIETRVVKLRFGVYEIISDKRLKKVYIFVYVCMYVYMHERTYDKSASRACIYVYICTCMYVRTSDETATRACVQQRRCLHADVYRHTRWHIQSPKYHYILAALWI